MPRSHLSGYRYPNQEEFIRTDAPRLMTTTDDIGDAEDRARCEDSCLPVAGFDSGRRSGGLAGFLGSLGFEMLAPSHAGTALV